MIMPNKFIKPQDSLIGVGAYLIPYLEKPITVSYLWEKIRNDGKVQNFDKFVSALDLLFILGVIILENDLIKRCQ